MKTTTHTVILIAMAITCGGCDQAATTNSVSPAVDSPPAVAPADEREDIDIHIDSGASPLQDGVERRQERRENLRDAIDDVDVQAGDGAVDVSVD